MPRAKRSGVKAAGGALLKTSRHCCWRPALPSFGGQRRVRRSPSFWRHQTIGAHAIHLVAVNNVAPLAKAGHRRARGVRQPTSSSNHLVESRALISHQQRGQTLLSGCRLPCRDLFLSRLNWIVGGFATGALVRCFRVRHVSVSGSKQHYAASTTHRPASARWSGQQH